MFTNSSGPAHWVFTAQDVAPAGQTGDKGSVFYQDADGFYTANVIDATVDAATKSATFTAKVTSSTISYANMNDTFTWTVYDKGEGTATGTGDYFTFNGAMLGGWEHPGTDHAVPHHGGQHPGPPQQLIQPRTNALD